HPLAPHRPWERAACALSRKEGRSQAGGAGRSPRHAVLRRYSALQLCTECCSATAWLLPILPFAALRCPSLPFFGLCRSPQRRFAPDAAHDSACRLGGAPETAGEAATSALWPPLQKAPGAGDCRAAPVYGDI